MLPNFLSIFRVLSIFPIIITFHLEAYILATILFLIASVTDFFDGYIARKYKLTSPLGNIYDHMSDSIFTSFFEPRTFEVIFFHLVRFSDFFFFILKCDKTLSSSFSL